MSQYDGLNDITRWTTADELLDGRWMLYTLNHDHVTFVRMPRHEQHYQAKQAPFLYITQQQCANHVAVMSVKSFVEFGMQIGMPKDKVLLISNSGRAGTTLLAQVKFDSFGLPKYTLLQLVQVDGLTVSFSEPDIFFALGAAVQDSTLKFVSLAQLLNFRNIR